MENAAAAAEVSAVCVIHSRNMEMTVNMKSKFAIMLKKQTLVPVAQGHRHYKWSQSVRVRQECIRDMTF